MRTRGRSRAGPALARRLAVVAALAVIAAGCRLGCHAKGNRYSGRATLLRCQAELERRGCLPPATPAELSTDHGPPGQPGARNPAGRGLMNAESYAASLQKCVDLDRACAGDTSGRSPSRGEVGDTGDAR